MIAALIRAIRIHQAKRAAHLAQRYYDLFAAQPWSAIGDNAWALYQLYANRARRLMQLAGRA